MRVLLVNGSPRPAGCTFTALTEVALPLQEAGIETEIVQVGSLPIRGCTACGACRREPGHCVFGDSDGVNDMIARAWDADGFIFGSPVHYAAASGALTSFLDRCFFAGGAAFGGKPGAAVVSCRRGGAASAFDQLNKYFTIAQMPVVSSQYWNVVHGNTPDEVRRDEEGMQTLRTLGRNMAWLLRCIEAGELAGIHRPEPEPKLSTNFIR